MTEVEYKQVDGPISLDPHGIRKVGFSTDTGVLYLVEIAKTTPLISLGGRLWGAFLERLVTLSEKDKIGVARTGVITNTTITVGGKVSVILEYSEDTDGEADTNPETSLGNVTAIYLPSK